MAFLSAAESPNRLRLDLDFRDVDRALRRVKLAPLNAEHFVRPQHGDQRELDCETGARFPGKVRAVEAMPKRSDFILGQHARARLFLGKFVQIVASVGGDHNRVAGRPPI